MTTTKQCVLLDGTGKTDVAETVCEIWKVSMA